MWPIICISDFTWKRFFSAPDMKTEAECYYLTKEIFNSIEQSSYWKADSRPVCEEIPTFYATQMFSNVFRTFHHWTLSCISWSQSISWYQSTLGFDLILSSHLRHSLPSISVLQLKPNMQVSSSYPCYMSHAPDRPLLNNPNNFRWKLQIMNALIK